MWTERGVEWANAILDGTIPSGQLAIRAVERFQRDLENADTEDFPYYFDVDEAERWLGFLSELRHVKGPSAGQYFEPTGYQCFCTMNLYGWRHVETGFRRFTDSYIEVARKNGKSFWAAGLGLAHLCIDNEIGAEIYCGATSEKQAWEVFRPARQIALSVPRLTEEFGIQVTPRSRALWILENGNRFEPIIGDPGDGPSPNLGIVDEFHEHKNANMVESLETGMGGRTQPLLFIITTAGSDFGGPCRERRQDVVRILERQIEDEQVFGIIFTIDDVEEKDEHGNVTRAADRWDDPDVLIKANPNLGVSVHRRYLLKQLARAKRLPSAQAGYRTKNLNQWVGAKAAWLNMLKLQVCAKSKLKLEDFAGRICYVGLDLASRIDLASMALLFPEGDSVTGFVKRWLPQARIDQNEQYAAWADVGLIRATEGDEIDFELIEDELEQACRQFDVRAAGYDPYQATQFAQRMSRAGVPMVEVGQTVKNLSEPMKDLEALIYGRRWYYDGDPCLTWQFGNVTAQRDKKDNIFPNKERAEAKIDDVVAILIAMNRIISEEPGTYWPSDGVIVV